VNVAVQTRSEVAGWLSLTLPAPRPRSGSWEGLGELKKVKQTTINKRIFIKIEVCVWEGKVVASGSEGGSSTDVALWWKKWKKMI